MKKESSIKDDPSTDASSLEETFSSSRRTVVLETIVEHCADRMAFLVRKHKIARELSCLVYGSVDDEGEVPLQNMPSHTYEKIRGLARAMLRQRASVGQTEAREDSIGYWEQMLLDPDVPWSVKARARENIDAILCVKAPEISLTATATLGDSVCLSDLGLDLEGRKAALDAIRARKKAAQDAAAIQ